METYIRSRDRFVSIELYTIRKLFTDDFITFKTILLLLLSFEHIENYERFLIKYREYN